MSIIRGVRDVEGQGLVTSDTDVATCTGLHSEPFPPLDLTDFIDAPTDKPCPVPTMNRIVPYPPPLPPSTTRAFVERIFSDETMLILGTLIRHVEGLVRKGFGKASERRSCSPSLSRRRRAVDNFSIPRTFALARTFIGVRGSSKYDGEPVFFVDHAELKDDADHLS